MILADLLKRNISCPICHYEHLTTDFFSKRRQSVSYEEDDIKVVLDLRSIDRMGTDYKVGYFFSLADNSFRVEFYTKHKAPQFDESVPLYLINNFNEFAKNVKVIKFSRKCTSCHRFSTGTSSSILDYKNGKISDIDILCECYGFITQTKTDYKVVVLCNLFDKQKSKIYYWRQDTPSISYEYAYPEGCSELELPLIPFVSEEETRNRLNGLLLFA
jgi:hypothetical protein